MSNKLRNTTVITLTALTALAVLASGCQTVQGVGKDIQTVGKKAEEVVKK